MRRPDLDEVAALAAAQRRRARLQQLANIGNAVARSLRAAAAVIFSPAAAILALMAIGFIAGVTGVYLVAGLGPAVLACSALAFAMARIVARGLA